MKYTPTHIYLAISLLLLCLNLTAQNQNRNWVFSDSIGIKFNANNSITHFKSNVNGLQRHGCASISNKNGDLLFYAGGSGASFPYTNELKIFRSDNGLLANYPGVVTGTKILTFQFFLPFDLSGTKYSLAHLEHHVNDGRNMLLRLSEIDLNLDNGLGAFTSKKGIVVNELQDTLTQGMYAIQHANGRDWWIIAHQWGNNTFFVLLVDENFQYTIYRQKIGQIHGIDGQFYTGGNLPFFQFDAQRNKLIVSTAERLLEIFDFDRCSGILSNEEVVFYPISLMVNPGLSFGYNALSQSGQYLYSTSFDYLDSTFRLLQFDLFSNDIPMSKKVVYSTYGPNGGSLAQIGSAPDGKIYAICSGDTADTTDLNEPNRYYLCMIDNPNQPYPACNFIPRGLWLNGRLVNTGLPEYIDYDLGPVDGSVCDTLGIDASNNRDAKAPEIKVYPNPTDGDINVGMIDQKFIIYNLVGSQVGVCESDHTGEVTLPNEIPDGIYFIQTVPQEPTEPIKYSKIQLMRNP